MANRRLGTGNRPRIPALKNIEAIRTPSGVWHYRVRMMVAGVKRQRMCATVEEAQAVRDSWKAGGLPSDEDDGQPASERTVGDQLRLREIELRENHQAPGPVKGLYGACRKHYPELLDLPVLAIDEDHFLEFRRRRQDAGILPNTIVGNLGVLRSAVKRAYAELRPDLLFRLSHKRVFPHEDLTRHRQFTGLEMKQALFATREPAQSMAELAGVTAMRQGEIRWLRRDAIDFTTMSVRLRVGEAKTGGRTVTVSPYAAALLRRHLARHDREYVFPNPQGRPYSRSWVWTLWKKAMRALGHAHWTFHDLRHHAAMTALANGASFPDLQAFGGWKSPKMVNRYATASSERLRQLQQAVAMHHAGRGAR